MFWLLMFSYLFLSVRHYTTVLRFYHRHGGKKLYHDMTSQSVYLKWLIIVNINTHGLGLEAYDTRNFHGWLYMTECLTYVENERIHLDYEK